MTLEVGQIFSTYAALARHLNEQPQGGTAKITQIAHWQRHFLWEKHGSRGYKITRILRPYRHRTVRGRWKENIDPILQHYFATTAQGLGPNLQSSRRQILIISTSELYMLFGLVNKNFQRLPKGELPLKADKQQQQEWHRVIKDKLQTIVRRALEPYEYELQWTISDAPGEWRRVICKEELDELNKTITELLKEMKETSMRDVSIKKKEYAFYAKLCTAVHDKFGWLGIHRVRVYKEYIGKLLSLETLAELRYQLNGNVLYYLESHDLPSHLLDIIIPI